MTFLGALITSILGMGQSPQSKVRISTNLRKTRSLIDKIQQMIDGDEYCINIMQQNLAAIGLLRSAHEELMKNHLATCFADGMKTKDPKKQELLVAEITKVNSLFNR